MLKTVHFSPELGCRTTYSSINKAPCYPPRRFWGMGVELLVLRDGRNIIRAESRWTKNWLCARICKIVHSTRLSERHYVRSVGRPNSTFSTEWPIKRDLAVEMTLQGRDDGVSATTVLPALGAWKPAKDAGFHIPTATATAAVKLGQTAKPAPIAHFYRFSCRTKKLYASCIRRVSQTRLCLKLSGRVAIAFKTYGPSD